MTKDEFVTGAKLIGSMLWRMLLWVLSVGLYGKRTPALEAAELAEKTKQAEYLRRLAERLESEIRRQREVYGTVDPGKERRADTAKVKLSEVQEALENGRAA